MNPANNTSNAAANPVTPSRFFALLAILGSFIGPLFATTAIMVAVVYLPAADAQQLQTGDPTVDACFTTAAILQYRPANEPCIIPDQTADCASSSGLTVFFTPQNRLCAVPGPAVDCLVVTAGARVSLSSGDCAAAPFAGTLLPVTDCFFDSSGNLVASQQRLAHPGCAAAPAADAVNDCGSLTSTNGEAKHNGDCPLPPVWDCFFNETGTAYLLNVMGGLTHRSCAAAPFINQAVAAENLVTEAAAAARDTVLLTVNGPLPSDCDLQPATQPVSGALNAQIPIAKAPNSSLCVAALLGAVSGASPSSLRDQLVTLLNNPTLWGLGLLPESCRPVPSTLSPDGSTQIPLAAPSNPSCPTDLPTAIEGFVFTLLGTLLGPAQAVQDSASPTTVSAVASASDLTEGGGEEDFFVLSRETGGGTAGSTLAVSYNFPTVTPAHTYVFRIDGVTQPAGTLVIPDGEESVVVTLETVDDGLQQAAQAVTLSLLGCGFLYDQTGLAVPGVACNISASANSVSATIHDQAGDVPVVSLVAAPATLAEGASGPITFSRSYPGLALAVPLTFSGAASGDYTIPATVSFGASATLASVVLTHLDDAIDKLTHTLAVAALAGPGHGVTGSGASVGLLDNDVPTFNLQAPAAAVEGTTALFLVTRNFASELTYSLGITRGPSVTAAATLADYTFPASVQFTPGIALATLAVAVELLSDEYNPDAPEGTETFALALSTATPFANLSPALATLSILDSTVASLVPHTFTLSATGVEANGGWYGSDDDNPLADDGLAVVQQAGDGRFAYTAFGAKTVRFSLGNLPNGLGGSAITGLVAHLDQRSLATSSPRLDVRGLLGGTTLTAYVTAAAGAATSTVLYDLFSLRSSWSVADLDGLALEVKSIGTPTGETPQWIVDALQVQVTLNTPPAFDAAAAATVNTNEDTPVAHPLPVSDANGDAVQVVLLTAPTNGQILVSGSPVASYPFTLPAGVATVTLSPGADFPALPASQTAAITYTLQAIDALGALSPPLAKRTVVLALNDAPLASHMGTLSPVAVTEDTARALDLAASDPDGDTLAVAIQAGAQHLTVAPHPASTTARVTLTPDAGVWADDAGFFYRVCDVHGSCSPFRNVNVAIVPVNDLPSIAGPTATVQWAEDATSDAIVLTVGDDARETAPGDLGVQIVTWTGSLALQPGDFLPGTSLVGGAQRSFTIRAAANLSGDATLSIVVTDRGALDDGSGPGSATLTVAVRVNAVADPVAVTDLAAHAAGAALTVSASGSLFQVASTLSQGLPVSLTAFLSDPDAGEAHAGTWSIVNDGNGCDPSFSLALAYSGAATTAADSVVSFNTPTFAANSPRVLCLGYQAQGSDGLTGSALVLVPIANVPSVPTIVLTAPASAAEGTRVTFDASGSHDDFGNQVRFSWLQLGGPTVALAGTESATLSFTVPAVAGNQASQAADQALEFELSAWTTWSGVVTTTNVAFLPVNLNQAPTVSVAGPLGGIRTEGQSGAFTASAFDPDAQDALAYLWAATPGITGLAGATGSVATFTAPQVEGSESQSANVPGRVTYTVAVQVADGLGGFATTTAVLVVRNANQVPVFTLSSSASVDEGATLALALAADPTDPDYDQAFSYAWSIQSGGLFGSLANPTSSSAVFTGQTVHTAAGEDVVVRLTIGDGAGGSAFRQMTVHVANVNLPPTVVSIDGATTVDERTTVTLTANASDPDESPLTYNWVQDPANPAAVVLSNPSARQVSFQAPEVAATYGQQAYTFTVEASDGQYTATSQVVLTIRDIDNTRPVFTAAVPAGFAGSVAEGTVAELSLQVGTGSGSDTASHVAALSQVAGPAVALSATSASCSCSELAFTVSATFAAPTLATNQPVTLAFLVSVYDSVATFTQLVSYTVVNANVAPLATLSAFTQPIEDGPAVAISLQATDMDADALSLTLAAAPAHGLATLSGCGAATTAAVACTLTYRSSEADYNGADPFTVRILDGHGGSALVTVSVVVSPVNDAPVFTAEVTEQTLEEDTVLVFVVSATDPDNQRACGCDPDAVTLAFDVANVASHGEATVGADGRVTYTPAADYPGPDDYFLLRVSDFLSADYHPVYLTILEVNDPPTFTPSTLAFTLLEDASGVDTAWALGLSPGPGEGDAADVTFVVGTAGAAVFAATPTVGTDGRLRFTLSANANGVATVQVRAFDPEGAASPTVTVTVTVTPVNDRPDFTKGADQSADNNAGAQTVAAWATGVVLGPAEEPATQQVSMYIVGNNNNALFSVQPAVDNNGNLHYTPNPASSGGQAIVSVRLRDDAGTANGGLDTSFARSFRITVT